MFVLSFTFTTPATGGDKDGHHYTDGGGSCKQWLKSYDEPMKALNYSYWMAGYITAFNRQTPDVYDIRNIGDSSGLYFWMTRYCKENPLNHMSHGMDAYTEDRWAKRKRTQDD